MATDFVIDLHGPIRGIDFGGEGRVVLLLHGLSGAAINWTDVGPRLAPHGRVVAIDLPGFGRTPPAGRSARVGPQADLVAELIEGMTSEPAVVIGNSMGASIAMILASRRPELVDRLILLDAPAPTRNVSDLGPIWALIQLFYWVPVVNRMMVKSAYRRTNPRDLVTSGINFLSGEPERVSRPLVRRHIENAEERRHMPWIADTQLDAYRSLMLSLLPLSFGRVVDGISSPTLLLHGTNDPLVPLVGAEKLAARRTDWTFVPITGAGHIAMLEFPDLFVELVDEFLAHP